MDALLKSLLFGLVFITMLILSSSILNAEEQLNSATIEFKGEKENIAYTYSDWADYPSEILVG